MLARDEPSKTLARQQRRDGMKARGLVLTLERAPGPVRSDCVSVPIGLTLPSVRSRTCSSPTNETCAMNLAKAAAVLAVSIIVSVWIVM